MVAIYMKQNKHEAVLINERHKAISATVSRAMQKVYTECARSPPRRDYFLRTDIYMLIGQIKECLPCNDIYNAHDADIFLLLTPSFLNSRNS